MSIFNFLTLLGSLSLFLFGMSVMGTALEKRAGGSLKAILAKLTNGKFSGLLTGLAVTAVIQSSSATTVMVVGFVNSGLLSLKQSIPVIMGANIGTTVTAWLLSLSGISGDSLFVQLLKPSSFTPVLAVIGIILYLTAKGKKKDTGLILLGFATLMFGMESLSSSVSGLRDDPNFTKFFLLFSNPILGVLAGAILTGIVQSSSASVGILQSLCVTGAVSYGAAIPIIMGQNIGTCVTALLSSIGASKNAKRTAFVHLYFNIIGTAIFMIIFYVLNAVLHFSFIDSIANPAGIAVIHSVFNIFATAILLPFHRGLEKLAILTVRTSDEEEKQSVQPEEEGQDMLLLLDDRFIEKPGFAMENCYSVTSHMAELSRQALFIAMELLQKYDETKAENVLKLENKVDHYEDRLGTYLIRLSSRDLSEKDSKSLSMLLHCIGDLERISDHAVNIMEKAQEMNEKQLTFSDKGAQELEVYSRAVRDIMNMSIEAFKNDDIHLARQVEPLEEVIDYLNDELKQRHVRRLRSGECSVELGFVLSDITINYERVADHCSNLAVDLLRIHENVFDVHEYLEGLKENKDAAFREAYQKDKADYALPQS